MVRFVHQVATERHTPEDGEGGKRRAAQSLIRAWDDPALSTLSEKPSYIILSLTLYSGIAGIRTLRGTPSERQNGRGLEHLSLMERKVRGTSLLRVSQQVEPDRLSGLD